MRANALRLALCVTLPAIAGSAAGSSITNFAAAGTDITIADSNQVIVCFLRNDSSGTDTGNTFIPLSVPASFTAVSATKDATACPLSMDGIGVCGGSTILVGSTSIQVVDSETTESEWVAHMSAATGTWLIRRSYTSFNNATIECVHAIPDIVVDSPAVVNSGQAGVTLDASMSQSVYEPVVDAPAIASFAWTQVIVGSEGAVALSGGASAVATFNAPTVTAATDFHFQITVGDGTLEATQEVIVTVSPPAQPVDAVACIDTSGSMGWHKSGSANDLEGGCCSRLASAKAAARYFIERLGSYSDSSRVGVVIFPGEPSPGAFADTITNGLEAESNFASIISTDIGAEDPPGTATDCGNCVLIPADGGTTTGIPVNWNGTPMRPGLEEARTLFAGQPATNSRVILLLSDGAWNNGGDPTQDVGFLEDFEEDDGIHIYTIGMGEGSDNVEHGDLQLISARTGVANGFTTFNLGDDEETNLFPHFEKILADLVTLDFAADPGATIFPGQTQTYPVSITDRDALVSFTVSWESSAQRLLDCLVVSPTGKTFEAGASGNGYRNVTIDMRRLGAEAVGTWMLTVHNSADDDSQSGLRYNYSVLMRSDLNMTASLDGDEYFTGDDIVIEARLVDRNRRLPGAVVQAFVTGPESGIGEWHVKNQVTASQLAEAPDEISGEPLTLLDQKNDLLKQLGVTSPAELTAPTLVLRDDGVAPDRQAGDGIYVGRYDEVSVPGVYGIRILASGHTADGQAFTRETQIERYVDIALEADLLTSGTVIAEQVNTSFFPASLLALLGDPPPPGTIRRFIVFTPRDALNNRWGPGQSRKITFTVSNGTLRGETVDMLDGAYVRVVDYPGGTQPTVVVSAGGVDSEAVPLPAGTGGGGPGVPDCPLPWWVYVLIVLVVLLLILLILALRN